MVYKVVKNLRGKFVFGILYESKGIQNSDTGYFECFYKLINRNKKKVHGYESSNEYHFLM